MSGYSLSKFIAKRKGSDGQLRQEAGFQLDCPQ